jgi:hypothetical protein
MKLLSQEDYKDYQDRITTKQRMKKYRSTQRTLLFLDWVTVLCVIGAVVGAIAWTIHAIL